MKRVPLSSPAARAIADAGPPWRDQLTDAQEREMCERERWEENCICEDPTVSELTDRLCPCHGDPEVIGESRFA